MVGVAWPRASAVRGTVPGVSTGEKQRPAEAAGPAREDAGPEVTTMLAAAVEGIGGTERSGQVTMAQAVERSIVTGEHLAVQAGTGTGKSLAYLVPAVAHAMATGSSVVVATATIALQRQLIDRDLPRLAAALEPLSGRAPTFAILKGRGNYLCRYRLNGGAPEEPGETLFDPAAVSAVGRQVQRLHEWAAGTETGDRDELVPGVEDRAWRQVAISAKECIGAARCPNGFECFAERARERAGLVDIVVTNHALLAIDALEDFIVLPEHDVVVIDEAHDLVSRVTTAASTGTVRPRRRGRRPPYRPDPDRGDPESRRATGPAAGGCRGPGPGAARGQPRPAGHPGRTAGDGADRAARRRYLVCRKGARRRQGNIR